MTYCIGWKHGGSVYLVADSAVTVGRPPKTSTSSFGENQCRTGPPYVEESILKIVRISERAAASYSGPVHLCRELIGFLASHYDDKDPIEALLHRMASSLGPFHPNEAADLLIAINDRSTPRLIVWSSEQGILQSNAEFAEIGSLRTPATEVPKILNSFFLGKSFPEEQTLAAVIAVVQSLGTHHDHMSQGVGGAYCGLRVTPGGIVWQRDTRYFLYNDRFVNPIVVSTIVRDDTLVISSTMSDGVSVFTNHIPGQKREDWSARWNVEVERHINSIDFDFWVFISIQRMLVTAVYWCPDLGECAYFSAEEPSPGSHRIHPTEEFVEALTKKLPRHPMHGDFWLLQFLDGRVNMLPSIPRLPDAPTRY